MDPTFGQATVDATHLSLIVGEMASQLKMIGLLGQLRVKVLEQK
jgi:hypothetical protein